MSDRMSFGCGRTRGWRAVLGLLLIAAWCSPATAADAPAGPVRKKAPGAAKAAPKAPAARKPAAAKAKPGPVPRNADASKADESSGNEDAASAPEATKDPGAPAADNAGASEKDQPELLQPKKPAAADAGPPKLHSFNSRFYAMTTDLDKPLAKEVAKHMDAVYMEYAKRMSGFQANPYAAVKANEKMPLFVFKKYQHYLAHLGGFGFNAANSGGVFYRHPRGSGLATWVEGQSRLKMYYVLQHEGFHQFADARIATGLPPWVNEGLAEYFGDALLIKGGLVVGKLDRERLDRMKRAVKQELVLSFKDLMTMNNDQWVGRVTSGDKASSLMYDSAWSVCYFLVHGGKKYQAGLETYLSMINKGKSSQEAFNTVFGPNLKNFESAWQKGLAKMEPDAWFTSVRHLQFMAEALRQFHANKVESKNFDFLKENLIRYKVKAQIRERDIVARGEKDVKVEHVEQNFDFPKPAVPELVKSKDPKLPDGLIVTGIKPTLKLSWKLNDAGAIEEEIEYEAK